MIMPLEKANTRSATDPAGPKTRPATISGSSASMTEFSVVARQTLFR